MLLFALLICPVLFVYDSTLAQADMQASTLSNGTITGRLLNPDGSLLNGVESDEISIRASPEFVGSSEFSTIDQTGRFTIPVASGKYEVSMSIHHKTILDAFAPATFEVVVESGEVVDVGDLMLAEPQVIAQVVHPHDPTINIDAEYLLNYQVEGEGQGEHESCSPYNFVYRSPISETGSMKIGGLPNGGYCVVIYSSIADEPLETFFVIDDENTFIDLGTLTIAASTNNMVDQAANATDNTAIDNTTSAEQLNRLTFLPMLVTQ